MEDNTYEAASQYFVVKDFANATATLRGAGLKASLRPYLLYLALCDQAFTAPDTPEWPFNDASRRQLRREVVKSEFWPDMASKWEAIGEAVPPAIIQTGFKLASKHQGDPAPIIAFVEGYLVQQPLPQNVFLTFLTDVLVNMQHDFYYARELAISQLDDQATQARILSLIEQEEADYMTQSLRETELVQQLEKERVQQAIEQANKAAADAAADATADAAADDATAAARTGLPGAAGGSEDAVAGDSGDDEKDLAVVRDKARQRAPRPRASLVSVWRAWAHDFLRSQGFYNTLILLFLLLTLYKSRGARAYLNRGRLWAWRALSSSLEMGLKVTYL